MSKKDPVPVSIVCATYERPEDTVELVETLRSSVEAYETDKPVENWFECIIVYPAGDPVAKRLEIIDWEALQQIESERSEANANRHKGVTTANGTYVAILDSDVVVDVEWVSTLQRILASHPDGGHVFQGAYHYDYQPQRNWFTSTEAIDDRLRFNDNQMDSRNIIFARDVYFAIGGLDTEHENADAATDLMLPIRLAERGIPIEWCPDVRVAHKYPQTLIGNLRRFYRYGRGAIHIQRRYPNLFRQRYSPWQLWRRGVRDAAAIYAGKDDPHDRLQITYILFRYLAFTLGYLSERVQPVPNHDD